MRTAYFILGMHRSGTSVLASTIDSLGITLGESLLPASQDNPKGYFENKAVQEFNESLLVSRGHGWDDVFFDLADIDEFEYKRLVASASRILEKEFGAFDSFAVKDPRLCLLLPMWVDACRHLGIESKVILTHRHPLEIAQSLKKRNGMSISNALALWADYMFKAEIYSRPLERILVSYDTLLNDFGSTTSEIVSFTGTEEAKNLEPKSIVDKTLRHHKTRASKLPDTPDCISDLLTQYEKRSLDAKTLDAAMRDFSSLKGLFYNAGRTSLYQQVFDERRKYKALKDDYFDKLKVSEQKAKETKQEVEVIKKEIEKQKLDKKNLTESIQHRDERIRNEVEKKKQVTEALDTLRSDFRKLDLSTHEKTIHLESVQAEIERLNSLRKEQDSIIEKYKEQLSKEVDNKSLINKEFEQLTAKSRKLELSISEKEFKIERLQGDIDRLNVESSKLVEQIKEQDLSIRQRDEQIAQELEKNKSLSNEIDQINHSSCKLEMLIGEKEATLERLHHEVQQLNNEIEKLTVQNNEQHSVIQQRDERIREETDKLNETLEILAKLRTELQSEKISRGESEVQLTAANAEVKKLEAAINEYKDGIAHRDERIREEAIRAKSLASEVGELQDRLQSADLANQHSLQMLEVKDKESIELRERVKDLKVLVEERDLIAKEELDKNKLLEKEINSLIHESQKAEIFSIQQKHKLESLQAKVEQLSVNLQTVESEYKYALEVTDELERQVKQQENDLQVRETENIDLVKSLKESRTNESELIAVNKALVTDIDKLDKKIEENQVEISDLRQKNIEALKHGEKMNRELLESEAEVKKQRQKVKSLEKKFSALEAELEKSNATSKDAFAARDRFEQKSIELANANANLAEKLHDLEKIIEKNLYEIKQLEASVSSIDARFAQWVDTIVSPISSVISENKRGDKDNKGKSGINGKWKTLLLSRRLENAVSSFKNRFSVAKQLPSSFITNFDESGYFVCNEDVEVAVENGEFESGLDHFLKFGFQETMDGKRKLHPKGAIFNPESVQSDETLKAFISFLSNYYGVIAKKQSQVNSIFKNAAELASEVVGEVSDTSESESRALLPHVPTNLERRPAPNHVNSLKEVPSVDIILPVYNALDDVKACVESLYSNQTIPFNLIVIDDCSEKETQTWLESAQKNYGFTLSRNTENLRFTKTVNRGFAMSKGDYVVLLNSDTIVTAYWLEKILCCFQSDKTTGIVGPLSNAASWQTVPVREDKINGGWLVNEIPEGYSIELLGQLIETISQRQYPNVPSVNGFCYVIKRDVINEIGTLDEEYFPTGYGEEDDFSIRARKAGFSIRVADDTYVFHAKSKSYTKEVRKVLTVGGRKSLDKKHGKEEIEKLIAAWKAEPLLPKIGKDIESYMQISSGNRKVVFTAIFGNYDNLKTPEYINPDWDYVCFTDNTNVESDVFEVKHVNPRFDNTTKNARMIKLLSHLFLINYDYSLWVDGSVKLRGKNINEIITNNLASDYISLHNHIKRDCVYEEADACMIAKKDGTEILAKQIAAYKHDGLPESSGIFETAEIARNQRAHEVSMLNSLWWQQLDAFSIRDQVALPYVFWKHGFKNHVMEGCQWLDAYFHMYKHKPAQRKFTLSVEMIVNVASAHSNVANIVDNLFEKTAYENFNVTVVLGNDVSMSDAERGALLANYSNRLTFEQHSGEFSPSDLNKFVENSSSQLCCLLAEDVQLFNSDWLDVLIEGFKLDTKATVAGPTILDKDFDFVAASVRIKRKGGELKQIFNARKIGGTGAVLAIHESCFLVDREQFVKLGGFSSAFKLLRSAVVELCHKNTEDKKHNLLVANSEVMISNDSEEVEFEELAKLL